MKEVIDSEVHEVQPPVRRRRSRSRISKIRRALLRRSVQRRIILTVFVVGLVLSIIQAVLLVDGINQLNVSYDNFNRVYTSINRQQSNDLTLTDFERLQSGINAISSSIATVNSRLRLVRPLTTLNNDWSVQVNQLDAANELVRASQDMLNGLQPVLFFLLGESEDANVASRISGGARIVELLEIGRGQFLNASNRLSSAQQILEAVPRGDVSPSILLQIETIESFYSRLHSINDLLLQSPELLTFVLGLNEQRSYLLLATNNDELRPSGGYLSTYGWIVVRDGRIIDYDYSPTTSTSPIPPPDTGDVSFNVPEWWIQYEEPVYAAWDGSWYVDFPSTAEMAMWYYNAGNNRHAPVDGVISIDIDGFEYLLSALGSVEVPAYNQTVTPANFRDVVYNIRAFGQGVNPHKRFVADVFTAIFTDWQSAGGDVDQNNALISALLKSLEERHIMIHFTNPEISTVINQLNWSGSQQQVQNHDYLMVADTNLGNKSNNSIIRQLTYDVTLQEDGTAESTLTVSYEYPASLAENDPAIDEEFHGPLDYGNLLQVFTPPNSILNTTEGLISEVYKDETSGFTNFVSRFGVEYDTSERIQLNYTTPVVVQELGTYERYQLLIQKQPGSRSNRVNVQVRMPANTEIISSNPAPVQSYNLENLILDFRIDLNSDQWIEITYLEK